MCLINIRKTVLYSPFVVSLEMFFSKAITFDGEEITNLHCIKHNAVQAVRVRF
jgi:hypothetical protein